MVLLSCANEGFCYLNLTEITKLKYERKNEKDCGRSAETEWRHGANGLLRRYGEYVLIKSNLTLFVRFKHLSTLNSSPESKVNISLW